MVCVSLLYYTIIKELAQSLASSFTLSFVSQNEDRFTPQCKLILLLALSPPPVSLVMFALLVRAVHLLANISANVCLVVAIPRSRLSASPATGLIGLPENGFLDDFFGSLGFIPLASER